MALLCAFYGKKESSAGAIWQDVGIAGQARNDVRGGGDLQGLLSVGISSFTLTCHSRDFLFCLKRNQEKPSNNKDPAHDSYDTR
jgi:hypothetical protein